MRVADRALFRLLSAPSRPNRTASGRPRISGARSSRAGRVEHGRKEEGAMSDGNDGKDRWWQRARVVVTLVDVVERLIMFLDRR